MNYTLGNMVVSVDVLRLVLIQNHTFVTESVLELNKSASLFYGNLSSDESLLAWTNDMHV